MSAAYADQVAMGVTRRQGDQGRNGSDLGKRDSAASSDTTRDDLAGPRHAPGDPAKAAGAIVDVTETAEPPLRLQLGEDAVERVEAKLAGTT